MRINAETSVGIFVLVALGIFLYMTFQIGIFQLDLDRYRKQIVHFNDISGLIKKADVKIAGVKVGWISDINLNQKHDGTGYSAQADIMIDKRYVIREDAYGVVRQDGLLGVKYLEIIPGDPLRSPLGYGESLTKPGKAPVSIDELLQQTKTVVMNVQDITTVLRDSLIDADHKSKIKETVENIFKTSEKIAHFSTRIDALLTNNENDIEGMVKDLRSFAAEVRDAIPAVKNDVHDLTTHLSEVTLPGFDKNVERVANVFERDFGSMADKLDTTADAIEQAALQTRDGFRGISSVANKINDGHGLIGKLVNDDEAYHDFKEAIQGLRNYFSKTESMSIVFDSHNESMCGRAEGMDIKNSKGYFDMRMHPSEDTFYVVQIMSSITGKIARSITGKTYARANGIPYDVEQLELGFSNNDGVLYNRVAFAPLITQKQRIPDAVRLGLQVGKIYKDIALRFGIIEGSFGIGIDYEIPFESDSMRWVSSFEMFDVRGRDRYIDDQRPHLKWVNKVFLCRNLYFNFGADDFVSVNNANGFFGIGLRFGDDDIKYFMSQVGISNFVT